MEVARSDVELSVDELRAASPPSGPPVSIVEYSLDDALRALVMAGITFSLLEE